MLTKMVIALFACLAVASAFTCPTDDHSFYHADVTTGCTVYHHCENGQLHTLNCPADQAFNHETSQCEEASTVNCVETMDHHVHHHHKRAVEVYHTIDIQAVKTKAVELYHTLKPILVSAAKDVAPSIYTKFEADYLPEILKVRDEALPVFYEKIWPQVLKVDKYVHRMAGKLFEKAYQSYEMSNSTHVVIPSMEDIAEQIANDLKPVIELGRYMSARLMAARSSGKRSGF